MASPPLARENSAVLKRERARADGRRMDDRRGRLPVENEAVEDGFELLHGPEMELHEEAVFAGDPVALDDLRDLLGDLGDLVELARGGADANDRGERVADRLRVGRRVSLSPPAGPLEPLDALGDGGRR